MEKRTDLISRADAIEAVHKYYQKRFTEDSKWNANAKMFVLEDKTIAKDNMEICDIIKALPSAEAEGEKDNDGFNTCNNNNNNADADYKSHIRLIDANALKAKWYEINDIDENDRGARFVGYTEIARLIDHAPTISAEQTDMRDK